MTFHTAYEQRSRRIRTCEGCGSHIAKGEMYTRFVGAGSDGFYHAAMHTQCDRLRSSIYRMYEDGEGLPFYMPDIFTEYGYGCQVEAQKVLDGQRGLFPNAVCRVELKLRKWLPQEEDEK